jgi:hypothetical protein
VIQNTIDNKYTKETNLEIFNTVKNGLNPVEGAIYWLGICIPSVCSAHEIETLINRSKFEI